MQRAVMRMPRNILLQFHRMTTSCPCLAEAVQSERSSVAGVFLLIGAQPLVIAVIVLQSSWRVSLDELRLRAGPAEAVKQVGPRVAGILGGKGGGRPGMYSGKATLLERRQEAVALLQASTDG